MIKTNKGEIMIKGDECEVLADYSVITCNLVEAFVKEGLAKEEAWKKVEFAFESAKKSTKELKEEVLKKLLEQLLGGEDDE